MNRKWLSSLLPWLGLVACNLAQAWQPPDAGMVANMLPPAPAGYQVEVRPMGLPGITMVIADYKALGSNERMSLMVVGQMGPIADPPGSEEPPPAPCMPDVYVSGQGLRQGFQEIRMALGDSCPVPENILYNIYISLHNGSDYLYTINASRYASPPFHVEGFQPLDALLDQIDLPALAALGG